MVAATGPAAVVLALLQATKPRYSLCDPTGTTRAVPHAPKIEGIVCMADNGTPAPEDDGQAREESGPQAQVVVQFIRDLSFESPNIESFLDGPGEQPNLNVEVSVKARRVRENLYESSINFTANASSSIGVIYDLEISYGGLFQITDMPEEALEPFLLINCPSILFPFLRRIVADLTREGSFPPLYLDPIDFAALYTQRQQSNNAGGDEDSTPELLN